MKTIKNNLPAIISIMMFAAFSAIMLIVANLCTADLSQPIVLICIGTAVTAITAFAKEKHIYNFAPVSYILVLLILCYQLFTNDFIYSSRYVELFYIITIHTASLLPLVNIQLASGINKYKTLTVWQFCKICAVVLIPALLVWLQPNSKPAVMATTVLFIVALTMSVKKRVKIHPALFVIPVIIAISVLAFEYNAHPYIKERVMVILTRGQSDTYGAGWLRTVIDSVITSAPFSVNAQIMGSAWSERATYMTDWYDHKILLLLGEYGWLGFILAVAAYAVFFACLFKMVKDTKQSTFARYTSFALALSLVLQAAVSLLSLFVLECGYIDMPFISTGYTNHIVSCLIFGIILALYLRRNTESEIEKSKDTPEEHFSFCKAIKDILFDDDDEDIFSADTLDLNFEYALLFGSKLVNLYEEIEETDLEKYSPQLARSYYHLAKLCATNKDYYDEAGLYYMKSLVIYERLYTQEPDRYGILLALCYNNAGNFFVRAEEYERAEELLLEAIKLNDKLTDFTDPASKRNTLNFYHDAGYCYEMQENYGIAAKYYLTETEKLREFAEEDPDNFMYELADNYIFLGNFCQGQKKYNKAQEYYQAATDIYLKMIDMDLPAVVHYELKDCYKIAARCAVKQFDLPKAHQLYTLARKVEKPYDK